MIIIIALDTTHKSVHCELGSDTYPHVVFLYKQGAKAKPDGMLVGMAVGMALCGLCSTERTCLSGE